MRWNRLHAQRGRVVRQGLQPCTCFKPKPKPKQDQRRLWLSAGWAGRCGLAGHAVNPSMGARRRHPWRLRSCQPTPPHPRQFPGDGWNVTSVIDEIRQTSKFIWGQSPLRSNGIRPRAPADRRKLSKAGWVRWQGREPHGCGDRAYMDVLAASPSTGPTPPTHRTPAFDVDVDVDVDVAVARSRCRAASPAKRNPLLLLRRRMHGWALPALLQSI